jgi:4-hydroxy-tetrahydrodipicolinate synthase
MKENVERKFVPVMLTPFKENGEIDFDGLTRLQNYIYRQAQKDYLLIASPVKCFI